MFKRLETKYSKIHSNLIRQSISGDERARFKLYSLYAGQMYNLCLRLLNRREDAEDVMQDAFADIFGKLNSFRYESSFGIWVKKIIINKCINFLRNKCLKPILIEEFDIPEMTEDEVDYSGIRLNIDKVKRAIHLLPEGYRVILTLYLFEGYDHTEIAQILGISESTSKSQYHRAKIRIRDTLKSI